MATIDSDRADPEVAAARLRGRANSRMHEAQLMLMAAGIAAFGIVAVAAAMLTTVL